MTNSSGSSNKKIVAGFSEQIGNQLFDVLAAEVSRTILEELYTCPKTPSTLSDEIDSTHQNIHYHLRNMEEVGIIEQIDTKYSERGKEMSVYAPKLEQIVLYSGHSPPGMCESFVEGQ